MTTILISGASGFIGSHLARSFVGDGHRVVRLSRTRRGPDDVWWDAANGQIDRDALARARPDVVVNLAGEPIARRWTTRRRQRIRDSRVNGTVALSQALASLDRKPAVLVSGSAIGYYGAHRGDELLDEDSVPGSDFLADTAHDWEQATRFASERDIRVVLLRTGVVLGRGGGALQPMLLPFRLGLGGRMGGGDQWMSWIALDDVVRVIRFVADTGTIRGPVNAVAPDPVQNAAFTRALAGVLRRPAVLRVPRIVLQVIFGAMADNTILASQRVIPKRLAGAGFEFRHPRIDAALRFELRRSGD